MLDKFAGQSLRHHPNLAPRPLGPFGARLQVTGYPNRPTFDLEEAFRRGEFEGKFQDRIRDIFSTEKMEKIIGGIEKELKDTTLKKKK